MLFVWKLGTCQTGLTIKPSPISENDLLNTSARILENFEMKEIFLCQSYSQLQSLNEAFFVYCNFEAYFFTILKCFVEQNKQVRIKQSYLMNLWLESCKCAKINPSFSFDLSIYRDNVSEHITLFNDPCYISTHSEAKNKQNFILRSKEETRTCFRLC